MARDHDQLTRKYCGASHNKYNINHFNTRYRHVFFHNLKSYYGHLITGYGIKESAIPNYNKKLLSFTIGGISFIDSFAFLHE